MKKLLLVVCVLALLSMAAAAYAADNNWLISIKAVNASFAGGNAVLVGVGTTTELVANYTSASNGGVAAEKTVAYGDTGTAYHSRHDVPMVNPNIYAWDLKIGAKGGAIQGGHIVLWNNQLPNLSIGGALNPKLAYAFQKKNLAGGYDTLAWFSGQEFKAQYVDWMTPTWGAGLDTTWHDVSVLYKNASAWTPSSTNTGFFVDADLVTDAGGGFADLADYRLAVVPEPGSLMALGSGLIGLAGFAIRRRRA